MVLFDSLNRLAISPYASDVDTPNFDRLAKRAATFTKHYVGSLPCMPARRDLHTGRLSFFHRSWGPLEPFDNSLPELLRQAGVYTHLSTDHYHYWEDGGATYHNRYDSYDMIRGQERDPWHGVVDPPLEEWKSTFHRAQVSGERGTTFHNYLANRERLDDVEDMPCLRTFSEGLRFLERNRQADHWFLQIETFDPHEPFFAPLEDVEAVAGEMSGPVFDWPPYAKVSETEEEVTQLRARYRALVRFCDRQLGRLLDCFDILGLWENTALIMSTDHGFLLGEHDWWAKNRMYAYEEIAHIPLMVHVPGGDIPTYCDQLTQTIDIMPTILDLFAVEQPQQVTGTSILATLKGQPVRETAVFGYFGGGVNITDGRYTYFLFPDDLVGEPLFQYTLMPTHMKSFFSPDELRGATQVPAFDFTGGVPVLKVPMIPDTPPFVAHGPGKVVEKTTVLFDLEKDPRQTNATRDERVEALLRAEVHAQMVRHDAPREVLSRFGFGAL
ncbi:MAG: sulfatase [Pseudomonadota bacterium]